MKLLAALLTVIFVSGLVAVNFWYRKWLARMSPEERAAEEEENRREMSIW